jgi:hypothetical protein
MAKKNSSRGIYYFADGTNAWYYGLSAAEKRALIRAHGAILRFIPTP